MAQRRFHYEQAFEHYLRANRVPYVAVDEAKKALMPARQSPAAALKSFDFVVYAPERNLLIDVKGRKYGSARRGSKPSGSGSGGGSGGGGGGRRFESWVTRDDVAGMQRWQELFGAGFEAVFVFAYCLQQQPPDALFAELFEFGGKWYALREVALADYAREMIERSAKWQTVHVPAAAFDRISRPFSARALQVRG